MCVLPAGENSQASQCTRVCIHTPSQQAQPIKPNKCSQDRNTFRTAQQSSSLVPVISLQFLRAQLYMQIMFFVFFICMSVSRTMGFSGGSVVKNPPAKAGDTGSIPGLGRSPGEGNGNPLQYSCLGNLIDRGAWQTIVHRVAKESDTTEQHQQQQHSVPKAF